MSSPGNPVQHSIGGGGGSRAVDFNNLIAVLTDTGGVTQQFLIPAGVRHIRTVIVGQGGNSTAGAAPTRSGAGGGAGGVKEAFKEVTPGTSENYAVGGAQSWFFSPVEAFANAGGNASAQNGGIGGTAGGTLDGFAVQGGDGTDGVDALRLNIGLTLITLDAEGGKGGDNVFAGITKGGASTGGAGFDGCFPGGGASGGGANALIPTSGAAATGAEGVIYIYASARVAPSGGGGGTGGECNCFLSTTSLKAATGFVAGQYAETANHSTVGDSWGAKYIAVADGSHTDGVDGWVEGANYLQGTGVQWELQAGEDGRFSMGELGLLDGTDAGPRLQAMNEWVHVGFLSGPFATLKLDTDVVLTPLAFNWKADGMVLDCTGGGSLSFQRSIVALPDLSADMVRGGKSASFAAVHGLSFKDVFLVWNSTPSSFNPARTNYYDGHMARVASVTSTTAVDCFGLFPDAYAAADVDCYKLDGYGATFKGFVINPRATAAASFAVVGYADVTLHDIECLPGALDTCIAVSRCYDIDVDNVRATAMAGNAYPVVIANSVKGEIKGQHNYSDRHLVGFGGDANPGAVPCRDFNITNCNFHNYQDIGVSAGDVHGNCDRFTYNGCVFDAACVLSGRDHKWIGCTFVSRGGVDGDCLAVQGSEPVGGRFEFIGCTFELHGIATENFGTIHLPIQNIVQDMAVYVKDCSMRHLGQASDLANWRTVLVGIGDTPKTQSFSLIMDGLTIDAPAGNALVHYSSGLLGTLSGGFRTKVTDNFSGPDCVLVTASQASNLAEGTHEFTLPEQAFHNTFTVSSTPATNEYTQLIGYRYQYPRIPDSVGGIQNDDVGVSLDPNADQIIDFNRRVQINQVTMQINKHDNTNFNPESPFDVRANTIVYMKEW